MRLKITLETHRQPVPFGYHHYLQGMIYHALEKETGDFLHDTGYGDNRIYKLFVYSELIGKYKVIDKKLVFLSPVSFYISSASSKMLNELYNFFTEQESVYFGNREFDVLEAVPVDDIDYNDNQSYELQTISPITCYQTDDSGYTTYFSPEDKEFYELLKANLERKYVTLYGEQPDEKFEVTEMIRFKKTSVKYKKIVCEAYICTFKANISDDYLKLLMHCGLGAKNSSGFGMMKIL